MSTTVIPSYTAFGGHRRIAGGPLAVVAVAAKAWHERHPEIPVFVFDDGTGARREIDLRGTSDDVLQRLRPEPAAPGETSGSAAPAPPRGRGRPRLGVVAREVTLLPRHWDWLAEQPGGASTTLRKLVEQARRGAGHADRVRRSQEAAYRFMSALAGDLPGFEDATRALFAGIRARFEDNTQAWPPDLRRYALVLAEAALAMDEG
jgi:hypothetical protein